MAAFAIDGLVADGKAYRSSFRHTAMGARWYVKLSCRGRSSDGRRSVSCRVTNGVDGENDRSLTGGRIRWTMKPR